MLSNEWRVIASVIRKDLTEWVRQPRNIIVTFLPSVMLFVVLILSVAAVGRNKVALVEQADGPHAQQMAQSIENLDAFIVTLTTPEQAADMLKNLQVEAVITIPANFETAYIGHQPDPVTIEINNLNLDFTNDLRRSLPDAITRFYGQQSDNPIDLTVSETDMRAQDVGLLQFMIVPLLIQLVTVAGVINTGLAAAQEWETSTIKELYLAPVKRRSLIIGKLIAGWIITLAFGAGTLVLAALTGYFHPQGIYWLTAVVAVALVGLASAGLGIAVAMLARRIQRVMVIGINLTFYLFFLSGGISVAAFLPDWVRTIAHFVPTYYGVHALQMAVFYNSADQLPLDLSVLVVTAALTVGLGTFAFRRRLLA
ncbi:MAG: ABC transporter permease [Aggregatilineales bacterium]